MLVSVTFVHVARRCGCEDSVEEEGRYPLRLSSSMLRVGEATLLNSEFVLRFLRKVLRRSVC